MWICNLNNDKLFNTDAMSDIAMEEFDKGTAKMIGYEASIIGTYNRSDPMIEVHAEDLVYGAKEDVARAFASIKHALRDGLRYVAV